jgi:hypothetical protein
MREREKERLYVEDWFEGGTEKYNITSKWAGATDAHAMTEHLHD